jgi:predicted alpha/beta-fold hydrolase
MPAHAGCDDSVSKVLDWATGNLGISNWQATGFSLGGNILLRLLAMQDSGIQNLLQHSSNTMNPEPMALATGDRATESVPISPEASAIGSDKATLTASRSQHQSQPISYPSWKIHSAIAVAPPVDLGACCDGMARGLNRAYANHFLRVLVGETKRRSVIWPQWAAIPMSPRPKTIREFDERFTAPIAGFASAADYYERCSSRQFLCRIKTPTLLLCDRHDPIVPARIFEGIENSALHMQWTRRGGHLGYLQRRIAEDESSKVSSLHFEQPVPAPKLGMAPFKPARWERWADRWIVERLTELVPALARTQTCS